MNNLTIIKQSGGAYIDSREVAKLIGKRHHHLLRDINGYIKILRESIETNFGFNSFFLESTYVDGISRTLPCYLLTKMGCEMVANKLTGEKGVLFTAAYVTRYNELESAERAGLEAKAATPQLKTFNAAVRNVLSGLKASYATSDEVMDFLQGAYKPFGIEVASVKSKHFLSATDIARICGIHSITGRPHGHAVAAIIDRLNIEPDHIAIIPYGLVGVSVRYDDYVLDAVYDWIEDNNHPHEIPHLYFNYHIYYNSHLPLFNYDDDGYFA